MKRALQQTTAILATHVYGHPCDVNMQVGFVRFNGVSLKHGAEVNTTKKSWVSFDFRVIPFFEAPISFTDISAWKEEDKNNPLFKNAHNFVLCR